LEVVGPLLTRDDHAYVQEVTGLIHDRGLDDTVRLVGPLPQRETPALYRDAFLHLNLSETGSMDKSVLEALACGCPALTSNPAFGSLLADFPELVVHDDRPAAVAEQVAQVHERRRCYERVALRALLAAELARHRVVLVNGLEGYVGQVAPRLRRRFVLKVVGDVVWERGRNLGLVTASFDEFQAASERPAALAALTSARRRYLDA